MARTLDTGAEGAAGVANTDVGHAVRLTVKVRRSVRLPRSRLFQSRGRVVARVLTLRGDGVRLSLKLDALGATAPSALARDPADGLSFALG